MSHYVVRHPDISKPGVVPESALELHLGKGWLRVSDAIDPAEVDVDAYATAPDLVAQAEPGDDTEPTAAKRPKKSTEESA